MRCVMPDYTVASKVMVGDYSDTTLIFAIPTLRAFKLLVQWKLSGV